jgi:cytochrome P450
MRPIVDFDHHSAQYAANWRQIDRDLRENTPVAWSEAHGGFWIFSRYADCMAAAQDWKTFTSENDVNGTGNGGGGILIPRNSFQFALSESDPPQSTQIRKIETPFLAAPNVNRWQQIAERNTDEFIDAIIESGKVDFVNDIAIPVPAKTVLRLAGIPPSSWELFAYSAHDMSHLPTTHPDYPHDKIAEVQRLILDLVRERRANPTDDVISALMQGKVNDAPIPDDMGVGIVSALVFGGFDTATTSILNALLYLDEHPELRPVVLEDPAKLNNAIEEWLRLFPPGHSIGRTCVKPIVVGGQQINPGERVLLLWSAANRDPAKFERPDEFWLERPNAGQHLTFSFGMHRCLGSLFGKMEIRVVLRAVLSRMGDYRVQRDGLVRYDTIGGVDGFVTMPATFTPGSRMRQAA